MNILINDNILVPTSKGRMTVDKSAYVNFLVNLPQKVTDSWIYQHMVVDSGCISDGVIKPNASTSIYTFVVRSITTVEGNLMWDIADVDVTIE